MLIPFTKMHAQGNDFVFIDLLAEPLDLVNPEELARKICDRHFGVGADGLVLIEPTSEADARMIIFNSDGSRAEMCGSALRSVASLLFRRIKNDMLLLQTDSGLKTARVEGEDIAVNLGKAIIIHKDLKVESFIGDLVDIGNPHFIIFCADLEDDPHLRYGAMIEHHPSFAASVNVHFVEILDRQNIRMKIWENAVGATLACGTGAASSVFAGIQKDLLDAVVKVELPGGCVSIRYEQSSGDLYLIGAVSEVFTGIYQWKI